MPIQQNLRIFEHAIQFICPHDDTFIGAAGCKFFSIECISDRINGVLVPCQRINQCALAGLIHQHFVTSSDNQLNAIGMKANRMDPGTKIGGHKIDQMTKFLSTCVYVFKPIEILIGELSAAVGILLLHRHKLVGSMHHQVNHTYPVCSFSSFSS